MRYNLKTTLCSVFCVRSSDVSNENLFSINRSRVQLVVEISQYKYQHQGDMPTRYYLTHYAHQTEIQF